MHGAETCRDGKVKSDIMGRMPRLSCSEARFRLEAIRDELEGFNDLLGVYESSGEESFVPRISTLESRIKRMMEELKEVLEVIEGHFRLKNIPNWKVLPDVETLKKEFKFESLREAEYRQGRSLEDFEIQHNVEAEPVAKLFEIGEIIKQPLQADRNHANYLSTTEVLNAIDKAGYRPATLQELLAFGRDYWEPDQTPNVIALNSVFSDADGDRLVPYLRWDGDQRKLNTLELEGAWYGDDRFLVLRKSS